VSSNEQPQQREMSQQEYENHITHLMWFCAGFLCALFTLAFATL
jgi:hypothetical protein